MNDLTISNGNANGTDFNAGGGGIYNEYDHFGILNCLLSNNYALQGGGMYTPPNPDNRGANFPVLRDCSFIQNEAIEGGAMFNDRNCIPKLRNCIFFKNLAQLGGAIYNSGDKDTFQRYLRIVFFCKMKPKSVEADYILSSLVQLIRTVFLSKILQEKGEDFLLEPFVCKNFLNVDLLITMQIQEVQFILVQEL